MNEQTGSPALRQIFGSAPVSFVEHGEGPGTIVVDIDSVNTINSFQVRELVRFLNELEESDLKVNLRLENVRPAMMRQFRVLYRNLAKCLFISSFYIPFFCEKCSIEGAAMLVTTDKFLATKDLSKLVQNVPVCDKCHAPMVIDSDMESYQFLLVR